MAESAGAERFDHAPPAFRRAEVFEEGGPGGDGGGIERILDVDHQPAGGAQRGADPVDVRHDLACRGDLGDLAWGHEAVLQIDHNMGSSLRN